MQMDRLRLIRLAVLLFSLPLFQAVPQLVQGGQAASVNGARHQEADEASAAVATDSDPKAVARALQGVTIHPMNGREPFVGTVLIQGKKILKVGRDIAIPEGSIVSELEGYHVTPGLIESRGKLWLTPAARSETNTKAALDVQDALDPWSEDWKELASQGITSVYVQPAASSFLGGYGAVVKVRPGEGRSPLFRSQAGLQASIGLTGRTSRDRFTQIQNLEKLLKAAQEKLGDGTESKDENADGESADNESIDADESDEDSEDEGDADDSEESEDDSEASEAKDSAEEALMRLLKKEIPLHAHVRHADAMEAVLRLAEEYDFRLVLDGLGEVDRQAEQLLSSGVPFCVGPLPTGSGSDSDQEEKLGWISELNEGNRLWTLSGFPADARSSRYLRMQSALAMRRGIDGEEALKAITFNAARLLGISDQVGSIAEGKLADLVVFAGEPSDPATPVRLVLSEGDVIYEAEVPKRDEWLDSESELNEIPAQLPSHFWLQSDKVWWNGQWRAAALEIQDGVIRQVREGSEVPADSELSQIRLGDRPVTTGFVNGMTSLGQVDALNDNAESDRSYVRAIDAVNPDASVGQEFLKQGFVHLNVAAGGTITAPGLSGHVRLGSTNYQADPETGCLFVLRESARDRDRYPASVNGQVRLVRSLLSGNPMKSRLYVGAELASALLQRKQDIATALKQRKLKAIFLADTDLEISSALRLSREFELDGILVSQGRLSDSVNAIQSDMRGIGVPVLTGAEFESQVASYASVLRAGVPAVFVGEDPTQIRMTAALMVSAGVSEAIVLDALTQGGGQTIGMEAVGLEKERPADLVIWSGNPIHLGSQAECVIVDGQVVSE